MSEDPSIRDKAAKMLGWKCFLSEKDSKILWNYGALLKEQGRIKKHTVYAITKYILGVAVSDLRERFGAIKKQKELDMKRELERLRELERNVKFKG